MLNAPIKFHFLLALGLTALFCLFVSNAAGVEAAEQKKIDYLLEKVESSNLTFVRNGTSYTGKKARDHLQMKFDYMKDRIKTADQFIDYVASGSSISGRPYYVIDHGKNIEAKKWLHDELDHMPKN